jgi:hypothetical protein
MGARHRARAHSIQVPMLFVFVQQGRQMVYFKPNILKCIAMKDVGNLLGHLVYSLPFGIWPFGLFFPPFGYVVRRKILQP